MGGKPGRIFFGKAFLRRTTIRPSEQDTRRYRGKRGRRNDTCCHFFYSLKKLH